MFDQTPQPWGQEKTGKSASGSPPVGWLGLKTVSLSQDTKPTMTDTEFGHFVQG